jgi:hypothetical protein
LRKYLKNLFDKDTVPLEGLVINFNQDVEHIDLLTFQAAEQAIIPVQYRLCRVTPCAD